MVIGLTIFSVQTCNELETSYKHYNDLHTIALSNELVLTKTTTRFVTLSNYVETIEKQQRNNSATILFQQQVIKELNDYINKILTNKNVQMVVF